MDSTWEGRDISVRDWARERGCRLGIARNHMGCIFRPNNESWKRLRTKIIKGALPGGAGILACTIGRAKNVAISESHKITRVAYIGQISIIGGGRAKIIKGALSGGLGYLRVRSGSQKGLPSQNRAKLHGSHI